jgi:threonine dehydrogenase-like Zn-dependent dehydrogenase
MTKKTKAVIYCGPRDIRVEEVDVPDTLTGDVLIATKATGICGSDVHIYNGILKQPSVACGHEYGARVIELFGIATRRSELLSLNQGEIMPWQSIREI